MNRSEGSTRLAIVLSVAVAAAVAAAIVMIDPPAQRQRRLDERRVADLMEIFQQINTYWNRHGAFPSDLAELDSEPGFDTPPREPGTSTPYGYEVKDTDSYQLCANFSLDTGALRYPQWDRNGSKWAHPAGRFCFDLDVDKWKPKQND
jgi:hypothetical protein